LTFVLFDLFRLIYEHVSSLVADLPKKRRSNQSVKRKYLDVATNVRSFLPNFTTDKVVILRALCLPEHGARNA